jgi:hypothetical protein
MIHPDSDLQYHNLDGSVNENAAAIKCANLFNFIDGLVRQALAWAFAASSKRIECS